MSRWELLRLIESTSSTTMTTSQPGNQTLDVINSSTDDFHWTDTVTPSVHVNVTDVMSEASFSTELVKYLFVDTNNTWMPDDLTAKPVTGNHSAGETTPAATFPAMNGSDFIVSQSDPYRVTGAAIWSAAGNTSSDANVTVNDQTVNGSTELDVISTSTADGIRIDGENASDVGSVLNKDGNIQFPMIPWDLFGNDSLRAQSMLEELINKHKDEMVRPPGKQCCVVGLCTTMHSVYSQVIM